MILPRHRLGSGSPDFEVYAWRSVSIRWEPRLNSRSSLPAMARRSSKVVTSRLTQVRLRHDSPPTNLNRLPWPSSAVSYTHLDVYKRQAYSSIGYFHDAVMGDLAAAESAFRAALRAGPHEEAIVGLARVLTQLGHPRPEVSALLDTAIDPMSARVAQTRAEINDGEWDPVSD